MPLAEITVPNLLPSIARLPRTASRAGHLVADEAAAPQSSLAFMFWGEGLFVFALMLLYTIISYSIFRGKVASLPHHY
jgi:cytochrome bd-type quinol oxidase subunit 2